MKRRTLLEVLRFSFMVKHKDIPKLDAVVFSKTPCTLNMKQGKYFWCACGRSQNHPFCDGSHHNTGIRPVRILLENDQLVHWCSCKKTKNPPFCDGSHEKL